jgi:DNA-binding MarR family transcriptional regulator
MSCLTRLRQLKVLRLVQRCPGITQAEVVEILRLHKSAALRVLQSLSGQHEIFGIKSRRAHSKAVFLRYYPLDVSRIQELEEFLKGVAE